MLPLEAIKTQIKNGNETLTIDEVLALFEQYDEALVSYINCMKNANNLKYKHISEKINNPQREDDEGGEEFNNQFELGTANGGFWECVSLRGWIRAQEVK